LSKQKVGRTSSTGRIPRPSTRVQRAEGEGEISEVENLILGQIRNYFDLPFSRHFQKFDENELANRILKMISEMELPTQLNIFYCLDPMDLNPNHPGPLPREDIDLFLVTVGNYILEMKQDDFDFQVAKRKADMQRQKIEYARANRTDPDDSPSTRAPLRKKVRKIIRKVKRKVTN